MAAIFRFLTLGSLLVNSFALGQLADTGGIASAIQKQEILRYPVQNPAGLWGFINDRGELVVPYKYFEVREFSHGRAAVSKNVMGTPWGFIDIDGNEVVPLVYGDVSDFDNRGVAIVRKPPYWDWYSRSGDSFAIDLDGNRISDAEDNAKKVAIGDGYYLRYYSGAPTGLRNENFEVIDAEGKYRFGYWDHSILWRGFERSTGFSQELAFFTPTDLDWGAYYRTDGTVKISSVCPGTNNCLNPFGHYNLLDGRPFSYNRAAVKIQIKGERRWGYINLEGQLRIPAEYSVAEPFVPSKDELHPLAAVCRSGKSWDKESGTYQQKTRCGYIRITGHVLNSLDYLNAKNFSEGLGAVQFLTGLWGYVDADLKTVIPGEFQEAFPFKGKLAKVHVSRPTSVPHYHNCTCWAYLDRDYAKTKKFVHGPCFVKP